MKFSELTQEHISHIKEVYYRKDGTSWENRAFELAKTFNTNQRTIRKWCAEKLGFKEKVDIVSEQYEQAKKRELNKKTSRYIVTWAQNNTPIHKPFFDNIKKYAEFISADIHIIAGRYKNPTSVFTDKSADTWVDEVVPYLDANRHKVHKYLSIMSDIKIQPTATNPMSSLYGLSRLNSCVFGSPKVHLEMIPVLQGNKPKMMLTTGSVTQPNYTDSKSGKKGEFHHIFGFVIIEVKDDETFYIRQVTADDETGNFTDLIYNVSEKGVKKIKDISAIVLGDLHLGQHDQNVLDKTHEFLNVIKPKNVILHDVFDGYSISHHDIKDPFIQYGKEVKGTNDLAKELDIMIANLKPFTKYSKTVIVRSNHDDFIDRWLKNEDWKKQPTYKNSRLYMKLSDMLLEQYSDDYHNVKGVIPALINKEYPNFITLNRSDSYKVKSYELGQHGDFGSNGSRGSIQQFRKLNTKIVVGHYHTPERKDNAISVGTSTKLRLGYNNGPSSWLQSHVIIHNDGKAQHINFIKDINDNIGFTTFEI